MFQMWGSCKLVCNLKVTLVTIIEKKAGILTRGDAGDGDSDLRYALEVDPEGLDDTLGIRVDGGWRMRRRIQNTSCELSGY